eukprot:422864-Pyramimonas_sp.AAC.2
MSCMRPSKYGMFQRLKTPYIEDRRHAITHLVLSGLLDRVSEIEIVLFCYCYTVIVMNKGLFDENYTGVSLKSASDLV